MTTDIPLEAIIRDIDRVLDGAAEGGDDADLRPFLITELYLNRFRPTDHRTSRRQALVHRAVDLASRLARGPLRQSVRVERSFTTPPDGPRHLFVFGFSWTDARTTAILRRLLEEMPDAALGVTDREDVFVGLQEARVPCLLLRTPRFLHRHGLPATGFDPRERRLMARGAALLEVSRRLLAEHRPLSVLTIQDFFPLDQAFTRAARQLGIPTITHQHGQIPAGPTSLYKYLFSDRMAVWGRRSADLMAQHVDSSRLWVVGTDRFRGLHSDRPPAAREHLVLGLNPVEEASARALVDAVTAGLLEVDPKALSALTPVLKLHPSMDASAWTRYAAAKGGIPWRVWDGTNEELLPRTRFLLARRSTLTLDAAVAGASVIELGADGGFGAVPGLFDDLPESLVELPQLGAVLSARLDDPALEAALLARQQVSLELEIEPGSSSAREAAVLRAMGEGTP